MVGKVLQLISSGGLFGAESLIRELAGELVRSGLDVRIGVIRNSHNPHTELSDVAVSRGIRCAVFDCCGKLDYNAISRLRSFIRKNGIEILHCHGYKANFYGLLATASLDVKRVATVHNWILSDGKLRVYSFLDKCLLRWFDSIVVVCEEVRDQLLRFGIPASKVFFVGNGVNIRRFQNSGDGSDKGKDAKMGTAGFHLRQSLGIGPRNKVIGTVGRLSREKGHQYLLEAARFIMARVPDSKFLIIGGGPLLDQLRHRAKSLGLERDFIFTGMRDDIAPLLGVIDVFVLPSLIEAMPMAMLEAMAARKPVVATRVGTISELIAHGRDGLIVEPGNVKELGESVVAILKDNGRAAFLGENAFSKVSRDFSSEKMAASYLEIYNGS